MWFAHTTVPRYIVCVYHTMTSSPKVRDFIRPIDSDTSYCEMLQARNKHQWSSDGLTWVTPDFSTPTPRNGGSVADWPRDKGRAGDERKYLSFWGDDGNLVGGCCSTSTATYTTGWAQSCKYKDTKLRTPAAGCPCARACTFTLGCISAPVLRCAGCCARMLTCLRARCDS